MSRLTCPQLPVSILVLLDLPFGHPDLKLYEEILLLVSILVLLDLPFGRDNDMKNPQVTKVSILVLLDLPFGHSRP